MVYDAYVGEIEALLVHGFTFTSGGESCRFCGLRSAFDVQDLLQETFSRAFRDAARARYDGTRPYGPYLRQIARNCVVNLSRSREDVDPGITGRAERRALDEGVVRSPEEGLLSAELRSLYQRFASGLAPLETEVLRLRVEEELPRRVVCDRTNMTPMALRTMEIRIKRGYAEHLAQSGYLANI